MVVAMTATEDTPVYTKLPHDDGAATQMFFILCDEGWRQSVICDHLFGWAADWLIEQIQGRPYAPGRRP